MKHLWILIGLSFTSMGSAYAEQEVVRVIGGSGDWGAALVKNHTLWNNEACVAATRSKEGSVLEFVAAKTEKDELYGEPTVQVVVTSPASFVRATIEDDKKRVLYHLVLTSTDGEPTKFGLVARVDERKKMVELLKKANQANLTLVNEKNKTVSRQKFSLKGSTKTIDLAMKECGLVLP